MRQLILSVMLWALLTATSFPAAVNPPLPFVSPMFGDNMVLQRGKMNTIWGWTQPGEMVRVELATQTATATANVAGRWESPP